MEAVGDPEDLAIGVGDGFAVEVIFLGLFAGTSFANDAGSRAAMIARRRPRGES